MTKWDLGLLTSSLGMLLQLWRVTTLAGGDDWCGLGLGEFCEGCLWFSTQGLGQFLIVVHFDGFEGLNDRGFRNCDTR